MMRAVVTDGSRRPAPAEQQSGNADYPWDDFDPQWYVEHNYRELRGDDRRIVQLVRDFFTSVAGPGEPFERGIDVGSGANLYPALAMLPFCRHLTLWERGASNVRWLGTEVRGFSSMWDAYWEVLANRAAGPYGELDKPRETLAARATVRPGNLFELRKARWDLGTMFFVAESISNQRREFKLATEKFIGSLRPGAPFAAAFMRHSPGYYVGPIRFPAVAVNQADVEHCLAPLVEELTITPVTAKQYLKEGYDGMILALGRVRRSKG